MVYIPRSKWTWSFFLTVLTQAIIGLALEAFIFAQFRHQLVPEANNQQAENNAVYAKAIPTLLSLLIFGFVYELLLVYDALSSQNTIQVIGIVMMNLGILVYTALQVSQVHTAYEVLLKAAFLPAGYWGTVSSYLIALPIVVAVVTATLAFLAWKLYGEFGWNIYKQIGADRRLRNRFFIYQIYIAILKFDFFLFVGFEIQFLVLVSNTGDAERWLTVVAIPITVVLLFLAAWSTRHENMIGMIVTLGVYLLMVAYFIFKLVRMYDSDRETDYRPARKTLTVFAIFTLLCIGFTIVVAIWCAANFNKGLKPHLLKRRPSTSESISGKQGFEMDYNNAPLSGGSGSIGGGGGSGGASSGQYAGGQYGAPRPYGGSRMEID